MLMMEETNAVLRRCLLQRLDPSAQLAPFVLNASHLEHVFLDAVVQTGRNSSSSVRLCSFDYRLHLEKLYKSGKESTKGHDLTEQPAATLNRTLSLLRGNGDKLEHRVSYRSMNDSAPIRCLQLCISVILSERACRRHSDVL